MKKSYLYQNVNVLASALILVLVVTRLDAGRYLQWVLFTTISGAAIQLETSLNTVVTRFVSRAHSISANQFTIAHAAARNIYHRFAAVAFISLCVGGGAYLASANGGRFSSSWELEWAILCFSYLFYYWLGHNACVLVALHRPETFSAIGIWSRLLNVFASTVLLIRGHGIMGLCTGVAASFSAAAWGFRGQADRLISELVKPSAAADPTMPAPVKLYFAAMVKHSLFVLASYSLYRVGLLIEGGTSGNTGLQASYGLALQVYWLAAAVASVPITMRVAPLVAAVVVGDRDRITIELALLAALVNIVFLSATAVVILAAAALQRGSPVGGVALPTMPELALLGFAYLVELNIAVLVNALLAAQRFVFTLPYYVSACVGLALGVCLWTIGVGFYHSLVLAPVIFQSMLALPLMARAVRREIGLSLWDYVSEARHQMWRVAKHPTEALRG